MSRNKEFDTGLEGDFLTLYHGTPSEDEESFRTHGIDIGRAHKHDPVVWATNLPTHKPQHWVHGSGWGAAYKQPSWNRVLELRVPRTDAELKNKLGGGGENYVIRRSVRPEEIVNIHNPHQRYGKRIAKAKELEAAKWKKLGH